MGNLCNAIFYLDSWGSYNVIQKEYEIEHIPCIGEMVVLDRNSEYNLYKVEERVFDFVDKIVHFRVTLSSRCYDLAVM